MLLCFRWRCMFWSAECVCGEEDTGELVCHTHLTCQLQVQPQIILIINYYYYYLIICFIQQLLKQNKTPSQRQTEAALNTVCMFLYFLISLFTSCTDIYIFIYIFFIFYIIYLVILCLPLNSTCCYFDLWPLLTSVTRPVSVSELLSRQHLACVSNLSWSTNQQRAWAKEAELSLPGHRALPRINLLLIGCLREGRGGEWRLTDGSGSVSCEVSLKVWYLQRDAFRVWVNDRKLKCLWVCSWSVADL